MSRVWIVVVHYSGIDDTLECLRSLERQTHRGHRVIVIDNASEDDLPATLSLAFPDVQVVRTRANLGWAGGNNVGIRQALQDGAEYVLLLNNDAVAEPTLLERLAAAAEARREYGVLGPVVRDLEPPHALQTGGFTFNDPRRPGFFNRRDPEAGIQPQGPVDPPVVVPTDIVMGCCLWLRRDVLDRVGLIDERFFLLHEESDFCLRAATAGFRVGLLAEDLLLHRGGTAFTEAEQRSGKPWRRYFDVRNLALILGKHAGRGTGRRGRWSSWREFFLNVYYYHSDAVARGDPAAARAIAEGVADAMTGRWGPYTQRRRPAATMIDGCLRAAGKIRTLFRRSRQVAILAPVESPSS